MYQADITIIGAGVVGLTAVAKVTKYVAEIVEEVLRNQFE